MADSRRRVLITGVSRFLGLRLAKRLENDDRIESLVGVDLEEPPIPIKGLEFVRADIRNPMIARVLEATKVDTLVHTNIGSSPALLGGRSQMKENNVIGTMQLLAAAQRAERIKKRGHEIVDRGLRDEAERAFGDPRELCLSARSTWAATARTAPRPSSTSATSAAAAQTSTS